MNFEKLLFAFALLFFVSCSGDDNPTGAEPDPDPGPSTGTLEATITTSGSGTDPDGYTISVDGSQEATTGVSETVILENLEEGSYSVSIGDVNENCTVSEGTTQTVSITAGETTTADFNVACLKQIKNKIVFKSNPDGQGGDYDIHAVNPDGTGQEKLFDTSVDLAFPELSHDGTRIVYRRSDDYNLYVSNVDGTELTMLGDLPDYAFTASWSPDDSQIVFSSGTEDDSELYVVNADGTGLTLLTDDSHTNWAPSWSPDGSRIAFNSNSDGDFEIYTIDPDGSNLEQITDDTDRNLNAAWSPDGSEIIFDSNRDNIYGDLYRMNADGSNVRRITTNGGSSADWSPDGSRLIYENFRDLHIINSDGSGSSEQVTSNPNTNNNFIGNPDWSPVQ